MNPSTNATKSSAWTRLAAWLRALDDAFDDDPDDRRVAGLEARITQLETRVAAAERAARPPQH